MFFIFFLNLEKGLMCFTLIGNVKTETLSSRLMYIPIVVCTAGCIVMWTWVHIINDQEYSSFFFSLSFKATDKDAGENGEITYSFIPTPSSPR